MKRALIVVDVQKDFCEGGRLAVAGGNRVADDISNFIELTYTRSAPRYAYDLYVKSRDFHDQYSDNDGHFAPEGEDPNYSTNWPVHCTIGSEGVKLHPSVARLPGRLFSKGYMKNDYSAFHGRACNELLRVYLDRNGITDVDVVGIAGDHCVRHTALDAVRYGYRTTVLGGLVVSVGGTNATLDVCHEVNKAQGLSRNAWDHHFKF